MQCIKLSICIRKMETSNFFNLSIWKLKILIHFTCTCYEPPDPCRGCSSPRRPCPAAQISSEHTSPYTWGPRNYACRRRGIRCRSRPCNKRLIRPNFLKRLNVNLFMKSFFSTNHILSSHVQISLDRPFLHQCFF